MEFHPQNMGVTWLDMVGLKICSESNNTGELTNKCVVSPTAMMGTETNSITLKYGNIPMNTLVYDRFLIHGRNHSGYIISILSGFGSVSKPWELQRLSLSCCD